MQSFRSVIWYLFKRFGVYLLALGGFTILLLLVHRQVYAYYSTLPRYQINLEPLEVMATPDWLKGSELEQPVKQSVRLSGKANIFDKELLPRLIAQYERNPWIAKVESVEKLYPNELNVKLEMRKPVVAVEYRRGDRNYYYLIDREIVRLPGEYRSVPQLPMVLPVVAGVRNSPPLAGEKWQDRGLRDAIAVAVNLKQHKVYDKVEIARIDVTNSGGRVNKLESEVVLLTKNKVAIQWGRSPETDKFGELSPEEKIKNLYRVLEVSPQLKGIKYVKIQFHQPYIAMDTK